MRAILNGEWDCYRDTKNIENDNFFFCKNVFLSGSMDSCMR